MTCNVTRQPPAVAFNQLLANFSAAVLGGSPIIPESNEWYVVSNDFAAQQQIFSIMDQQFKELDPRTACCDNLLNMAAIDGVYPKAAAPAQGYVKIFGTVGTAIPFPLDITIGSNVYRVVGTVPLTMPIEKNFIARVQAIVPGSAGNFIPASRTGTLTPAVAGLITNVTVLGSAFCSGSEVETCEQFRSRYLERKAYKPRATMAYIKEKILEWPCATRVFERAGNCCDEDCGGCNCVECGSKLDFYVMFDGTFDCGVPAQCVVDDLNLWVFGEKPGRGTGLVEIGVCGKIYRPTASKIAVTIDGLYCTTPDVLAEIRQRVEEVFFDMLPSTDVNLRILELAVTQAVGVSTDFEISLSVVSGTATINACNGIEVPCDVIPCLESVSFRNSGFALEVCT